MEIKKYIIIDLQTKKIISKDYSVKNRNRARNKAEKLNLNYGGHRFTAKAIFIK